MKNWQDILIKPETTLRAVLKLIDATGWRAALVVDDDLHLLGLVTDGDLRRALLNEIDLNAAVQTIMKKNPLVAHVNDAHQARLALLQQHQVFHLPIVDDNQHLVGFETLEQLVAPNAFNYPVMVMAGGLGKRLQPLTNDCPKPLIKINNKPVLEILIENFIKSGFTQFQLAVNYKAQMIKDYFGNGERYGAEITYIEEEAQLGTAGALSLLPATPLTPFFVINADVITNINFKALMTFHLENKVAATICIREHAEVIPFGVIERQAQSHHLLNIIEKPQHNYYVNAGIYILEPQLLSLLDKNTCCDMPQLLTRAIEKKLPVATFPIHEYWLDVGRHEDLAQAVNDYEKVF